MVEFLSYMEIIKEGFKVANRNLAVLLTQFLAGLALLFIFLLFLVLLAFMAIASIPAVSLKAISPDTLPGLIETSLGLIVVGAFLALIFVVALALITSYVHAGNLGCLIGTAEGALPGFKPAEFFRTGRRSMLPMFGLYVIWGLFSIGCFFFLLVVGGVVFDAVLIPLKDAGRGLLAFGIGVPFLVVMILAVMLFLFFIYAGWAFSGIILVGEEHTALSSLRESYGFIKRKFWDSLLFALLMFALVFTANLVNQGFLSFVKLGFTNSSLAAKLSLMPLLLVAVLLQMYLGLIARSCFVVYYVNRTHMQPHMQPETAPPPVSPTTKPTAPPAPPAEPEGSAPDAPLDPDTSG